MYPPTQRKLLAKTKIQLIVNTYQMCSKWSPYSNSKQARHSKGTRKYRWFKSSDLVSHRTGEQVTHFLFLYMGKFCVNAL